MIRWTVLDQHFVAHPMVIARALPDSRLRYLVIRLRFVCDPLDLSGSKSRCASDGDSEGPPRQL
eukprot:13175164-Heterocapsa_arctica.AAC.1